MEKPLSPQEIALQKKKMQIDMQILKKRKQSMSDMKNEEVIPQKNLLLGQERQVRTKKVDSMKKDVSLTKEKTQVLI